MKSHFFECQCMSDEHILKFIYDKEDRELYTTTYLSQYRNIFQRIWVAVKYVFGYKCKFGAWDCFIFKNEDIRELHQLLKRVKVDQIWATAPEGHEGQIGGSWYHE